MKLAALAAVAVGLFSAGSAVKSEPAHAFAWSDQCKVTVINRAAQSAVRPIALLQLPPNAVSYGTYTALLATGFPSNKGVSFSTTGLPVTWGCRASITINNPGENVNCNLAAPTEGANTFRCTGNQTYRIDTDNDDIIGTVEVAVRGAATEPESDETTPPPTVDRFPAGVLKKGQLSGKGWVKTTSVEALGTFGELFEDSNPPASCDNGTESGPRQVSGGASLFVRGGGREAVGEFDGTYSSRAQAGATLTEATSRASARCLAAALNAPGYTAKLAAHGPNFGQGGIPTARVIVKKNGGGFTGYVDLVGLQLEKRNTVLLFMNAGKPAPIGHEEDVLEAVADSLQG